MKRSLLVVSSLIYSRLDECVRSHAAMLLLSSLSPVTWPEKKATSEMSLKMERGRFTMAYSENVGEICLDPSNLLFFDELEILHSSKRR